VTDLGIGPPTWKARALCGDYAEPTVPPVWAVMRTNGAPAFHAGDTAAASTYRCVVGRVYRISYANGTSLILLRRQSISPTEIRLNLIFNAPFRRDNSRKGG